jgi:hypothetical protein
MEEIGAEPQKTKGYLKYNIHTMEVSERGEKMAEKISEKP